MVETFFCKGCNKDKPHKSVRYVLKDGSVTYHACTYHLNNWRVCQACYTYYKIYNTFKRKFRSSTLSEEQREEKRLARAKVQKDRWELVKSRNAHYKSLTVEELWKELEIFDYIGGKEENGKGTN